MTRTGVRLVTGAVIAMVLVAGLLVGFALGRGSGAGVAADVEPRPTEDRTEDGDERGRRGRTPMYEQVNPTEDQLARIDSILAHQRSRMRELHDEFEREYDPRYRELIIETREEIKAVFTEAQADRYQTLLDEYDGRRAEREEARRRNTGGEDGDGRPNG